MSRGPSIKTLQLAHETGMKRVLRSVAEIEHILGPTMYGCPCGETIKSWDIRIHYEKCAECQAARAQRLMEK